jgi:2-octaprenyl-3-methyl-6-methoxy-1,4-benzoquinol hydroxylase
MNSDVIVVGGGMVGTLTAAALGNCGLDVVLLEQQTPAPFDAARYDLRVSALSEASERMLDAVDAWQAIDAMRVCPYRRMLVWDASSDAKTQFDSTRIGRSQLGHIVENRVIQLALWQQLEQLDNVQIRCPSTIEALHLADDRVEVTTDSGRLSAALLVAADGANSTARQLAGIRVDGETYPQHALVATVHTGYPQQDITWQRFTPQGPQAFLPLAGSRASMVWYETAETVAMLRQLPEADFIQAMTEAFPDKLGHIESVEARGSFPLQWQHAEKYVLPRVALVGDAAHTVHPLAGQGVNLGMLDAGALVDCVIDSFGAGKDIGSLRTLRRYERWRQPANAMMIRFLDGIYHAFQPTSRDWLMKGLRTVALRGAEHIGPVNEMCIRTAMGLTGNLPRLAHGRLPTEA